MTKTRATKTSKKTSNFFGTPIFGRLKFFMHFLLAQINSSTHQKSWEKHPTSSRWDPGPRYALFLAGSSNIFFASTSCVPQRKWHNSLRCCMDCQRQLCCACAKSQGQDAPHRQSHISRGPRLIPTTTQGNVPQPALTQRSPARPARSIGSKIRLDETSQEA